MVFHWKIEPMQMQAPPFIHISAYSTYVTLCIMCIKTVADTVAWKYSLKSIWCESQNRFIEVIYGLFAGSCHSVMAKQNWQKISGNMQKTLKVRGNIVRVVPQRQAPKVMKGGKPVQRWLAVMCWKLLILLRSHDPSSNRLGSEFRCSTIQM